MSALSILLLTGWMSVHADLDPAVTFEPAYAANQSRITTESLQHEAAQFQALRNYHSMRAQVESAKRRRDRITKDLNNSRKLADKSYFSKDNLLLLEFKAVSAANEVSRLEIEVEQAKAAMQANRLKLLSEGGSSQDLRKEIVLASLDEARCQLKSLNIELTTAELAERMWTTRVDSGRRLHQSGALSEDEFEDREVSLRVAKAKVRGIKSQIRAAEASLKGLEQSLKRLQTEPNVCCRI